MNNTATKFAVILPLVLTCIASCHSCGASLSPFCRKGAQCWPNGADFVTDSDIPDVAYRGECHTGEITCDDSGIEHCSNAVTPSEEVCNNKDDDCNGAIDDVVPFEWGDPNNDCNLCGRCHEATKVCVAGAWQCQPLFPPQPEECNGIDDDCNCIVDDIPVQYSYPDAQYPGTDGVGECRPEIKTCENGVWHDIPAVTPKPETCNGLDDDCNGLVDDGLSTGSQVLLVINVDVPEVEQGSSVLVDSITQALGCDGTPVDGSFAVVEVAEGMVSYPFVRLDQDFADAVTTCATLTEAAFGESDEEQEFILDGMVVAEGLNWAPTGDRWVFAFTDEPLDISTNTSMQDIENDCTTMPYKVGAFVDSSYNTALDPLISTCGGFKDSLLPWTSLMSNVVSTHLTCSPPAP